jgi:hypothetical protein
MGYPSPSFFRSRVFLGGLAVGLSALLGVTLTGSPHLVAEELSVAPDSPPSPPASSSETLAPIETAPPTASDAASSSSPLIPPPPPPADTDSAIPATATAGTEDSPPTASEETPPTETAESSSSPPPADAPVIEPPRDASEARAESVIRARREKWVPAYQLARPAWGISVTGSLQALGGSGIALEQGEATARAAEIQAEYQFPFLQAIGVISLGPSVSIYPMTPSGTVTASPASLWAVGGQIRYQARFLREQPIVPMVGYEAQRLAYRFNDGAAGSTIISGPAFGAMFLLNILEPSSASELYINQGVSRSYLLAEYKTLAGTDGTIDIGGASLFFGLRFEF